MKRIISLFVQLIWPFFLFAQDKSLEKEWYKSDFFVEGIKILATGVVTFVISYIIFKLDKQRKEKKQISYDVEVKNGLLEIDESIQNYVDVSYKKKLANNLAMVTVRIQNTGNLLIKNQNVRFSFKDSSKVIDTFFEPQVEPELFLTEIECDVESAKKYNIGHFEKFQFINFKFIVEGEAVDVKLIPFNQEGNVDFNYRSINKQKDSKSVLYSFFLIGFFFLTIPSIFSNFFDIGELTAGALRLVLFLFWYPTVVRSINILIDLLLSKTQSKSGNNVMISGGENRIDLNQVTH